MTLIAARELFVDGCWEAGEQPPFDVSSPATDTVIATVAGASTRQVDAAIAAARRAFDSGPWPTSAPSERIAAVRRLGEALHKRRGDLLDTVVAETGCPRTIADYAQVHLALESIRELTDLYAAMPSWEHNRAPLEDHLVGSSVRLTITRYEAAGVVAAITPYNFPFITNVWKVIPALLAGCTVVLRPSPLTPLQALVFGSAAEEAGLPAGVLNVVVEEGSQGAELLTTHPAVDTVSFTGSTVVGRSIASQAAPTLKRLILELGGKSAQLHLPDALETGLDGVIGAATSVFVAHAGQGCSLQTRVLVPDDRRHEVIEALELAASSLHVGDPDDPKTTVGPLISRAHRDRVHGIVESGIAAGATLACGGRVPPSPAAGWYYEPTLLDVPTSDNPAAQQEIFGPVACVLGYRDLDHAVAIANDSELGLSGGIYTRDLRTGLALADRIRSGTVQVNTSWATGYTPMGGVKQSGYGRERGAAGIRAFQDHKHVIVGSV